MARPSGHRLNAEAWNDFVNGSGKTLTTVAELADLPRATLSSLLGGHHRASAEQAHRIAMAAGLHPATLFPSLKAGFATVDTEDDLERAARRKRAAA